MKPLTEKYFKKKRFILKISYANGSKLYEKGSFNVFIDSFGDITQLSLGSVILTNVKTENDFELLNKLI